MRFLFFSFLIITALPLQAKQLSTSAIPNDAGAQSSEQLPKNVIARVNGYNITVDEANNALESLPPIERKSMGSEKAMQHVLQSLIADKTVLSAAIENNVQDSPIYKEALKNEEERLARQLFVEQAVEDKISDEALKKEYAKRYPADKDYKEVKAKHILVETQDSAASIITELQATDNLEATFTKIAKEKSIGPSGASGGILGWFDKTAMVKPFSEVAFQLNKGEVSKAPVKTRFGYHVIYVTDTRDGNPPPFTKVVDKLRQEVAQKEVYELLKELQLKADVVVNESAIKNLAQ